MRIQYISDIHLEFVSKLLKSSRFSPCADVLCLAGDIGYPSAPIYRQFLKHVSSQYKKIFLITGNHEYYKCTSMDAVHTEIYKIIKENQLKNISFLDNSYEDYCGVRFVGTTLWSSIPAVPDVLMNDFHEIPNMTPALYNELHSGACEFLDGPDVQESPLPIVILSHHLPSADLIDPKYAAYTKYNQFFASDCSRFFKAPVKAWICGHTHSGFHTTRNGIQFACNPVGYPSERERQMSYNAVIEIE